MKIGDKVRVLDGRAAGCLGELIGISEHDEVPVYEVLLTEVPQQAHQRAYRVGDQVDFDRHQLEVAS